MRNICLVIASIAALASQLSVADEANRVASCVTISDPVRRLECYDKEGNYPEQSEYELSARKVITKSLKDPDSARFGRFAQVGDRACLGVNAKNAFGGYTGEQQALMLHVVGAWMLIGIHQISHDQCVQLLSTSSNTQPSKPCSVNQDCPGQQICYQNLCQIPPGMAADGGKCKRNRDCVGDLTCKDEVCTK